MISRVSIAIDRQVSLIFSFSMVDCFVTIDNLPGGECEMAIHLSESDTVVCYGNRRETVVRT